MATAPHAPQQNTLPPPPPPKAAGPAAASEKTLESLQAMINLVLIQSGQFLHEQLAGTPSRHQEHHLKRIVPAGIDRFQDALDGLEGELQQAQAVLRRDLALLQADRRKRELAEAAERQRLAAASSAQKHVVPQQDSPAPTDTVAAVEPMDLTDDASNAGPGRRPSESHPAEEAPPPTDTEPETAPAADPLFDGTPTTPHAQDTEFDFDAMFGDSAGDAAAGADSANDATNEKGADHDGDIDMDASGPDLDFSLDEPVQQSAPSLLAGLEDFAKSSAETAPAQPHPDFDMDFAMPDLPDLPTHENEPSQQPPKSTQPAETPSTQQPAADAQGEESHNTMPNDELDDLFNMDYSENPEASEFDNAFLFD